jgi:hypothetical protein
MNKHRVDDGICEEDSMAFTASEHLFGCGIYISPVLCIAIKSHFIPLGLGIRTVVFLAGKIGLPKQQENQCHRE